MSGFAEARTAVAGDVLTPPALPCSAAILEIHALGIAAGFDEVASGNAGRPADECRCRNFVGAVPSSQLLPDRRL